MTEYRRAKIPGATYFFTVNCAERKGNSILTDNIDPLRNAFRKVKNDHPFEINAIVSFHKHVGRGLYPLDWAYDIGESNSYGE